MMAKRKYKKGNNEINPQGQDDILKRLGRAILLFFNKEYIRVGGILILAFLLRLIYISQIKANDPNFLHLEGTDQGAYDSAARQILDGTFPKEPYYYNPGYYYFLSLVYLIFGHNREIAINVQILIGIVTYLLTYLIARKVFNKNTAFISLILCSFYGIFMVYEGVFLSAVLEVFFLTLIIFLLVSWINSVSYKKFLLIGMAIGFAALVRPTILLLTPIFLFWIFIKLVRERKKLIVGIGGILLGLIISISPCTIRNYLCNSKLTLISSNGPVNFWIGNNPDANGTYGFSPYANVLREKMEKTGQDLWIPDALNFIKKQPEQYLRLLLKKFCLFWDSYESPDNDVVIDRMKNHSPLLRLPFILSWGIIIPLGIGGIFLSLRKWWKKSILLYMTIIGYTGAVVLFFIQSRFRIAIIPLLIIFAGFTIYHGYEKIRERKFNKLFISLALVIIFYLMVNFQTHFGWTYPMFHPEGTIVNSREGFIIRDDSGEWHGEGLKVLDSPEKIIKKEIIIEKDISQIKDAQLILNYFANDKGNLLIKVNDYEFPKIPCSQITYGRFMRLAKFGLKSSSLRNGTNTISLKVTSGGNVQISVDNMYNYGRSSMSNNGKEWEKMKGEFMVQLELEKKSSQF